MFTESTSSALCWLAAGQQVAVDLGLEAIAHVSGIKRCGSPWSCPLCAPVVREKRARDIDQALRHALDKGMGCELVTGTVQHHRSDALGPRLEVVANMLRFTLTGSAWKRRAERLGYVGAIKAVEITYGANGWHPHVHVVLVFERPLTDEERADLRAWMFGRWKGVLERKGLGTLSPRYGIDVRPVREAADLAGYLTKVEGGWGAGLELARSDIKRGRGESLSPFEMLDAAAETGEAKWVRRWQEYERATFGKRAIVWSPGLRKRLLGTENEVSDVEAAASEGLSLPVLRAWIERAAWNKSVLAGVVCEMYLDPIEQVGKSLLLMSQWLGHPCVELDDVRVLHQAAE